MTSPTSHPDLYDTYKLGGVRSPGIVTLRGLKKTTKWEVKDAEGQDGASTSRKGRSPIAFSAVHQLALDPETGHDDFADWDRFLPLLERASGDQEEVTAYDFQHPDAQRLKISSVVVTSIGGLDHDGTGGATVEVGFLQYAEPKKKTVAGPSGSKSTSGGTGGAIDGDGSPAPPEPPDPNAAAKEQLAKLLEEAQKP